MADPACAPWCRAAFYVLLALVLAVFAITGAHPSRRISRSPDSDPSSTASGLPPRNFAAASSIANVTRALRRYGFVFTATLLQLFPDRLLPAPAATVFAIPDAALDDFFSLPPWLLLDLVRYHAAPSKLSFHNLSTSPPGSTCIPTLLPGKNLAVRRRRVGRSVDINGVLITQPDVFLDDRYAVHGLQRPVFSPGARDEIISPPPARRCGPPPKQILDSNASLPWNSVVRALSSRGYISFSIGIHSVLDGLKRDWGNLSSVTVFAPAEDGGFQDAASPAAVLERSVRLHLLPQKLTFAQLSRMRSNVILPTLVQGRGLHVMGTSSGSNKSFSPSEKVEIVEPEALATKKVVIHGVSRALEAMAVS